MGKTHRDKIAAIMAQYHEALEKARREFDRYGEVLPDTDKRLTLLEDRLAMVG